MPYPTYGQLDLGLAEADDAEALGFRDSGPSINPRHDRAVDRAICAVLGLCIGVMACAGLTLTHYAPASRCAPHLALWEP